jgi:hypothetical protein
MLSVCSADQQVCHRFNAAITFVCLLWTIIAVSSCLASEQTFGSGNTDSAATVSQLKSVENFVRTNEWLTKWKAASPEHSITYKLLDSKSCDHDPVFALWQTLHIEGKPEDHVCLFSDGALVAEAFCGPPYQSVLVTDCGKNACTIPSDLHVPCRMTWEKATVVIDQTGNLIRRCDWPAGYLLFPVFAQWSFDHARVGLVSDKGKIVLAPVFDSVTQVSSGVALVSRTAGKFQFINLTDGVELPGTWDSAGAFSEGLAPVELGGKWGYIDRKGTLQIPLKFDHADTFKEGLAPIKHRGMFGYIDRAGKIVIQRQFDDAKPFEDRIASVQIGTKHGYIDHSGKPIGGRLYDDAREFSEGLAAIGEFGKPGYRNEKLGFINSAGAQIVSPRFRRVRQFEDGLASVLLNDSWGYINSSGKYVVDPEYESAYPFSSGLAQVWQRGTPHHKFVDRTGNTAFVTNLNVSERGFHCGLIGVEIDHKCGFLDATGKLATPLFEGYQDFSEDLGAVCSNNKFAVIDTHGQIVVPFQYDGVGRGYSEGLLSVKLGTKWGAINRHGDMVIKPQFERVGLFRHGVAEVQSGMKVGYVNAMGNLLIEPQFDYARPFSNGFAQVFLTRHSQLARLTELFQSLGINVKNSEELQDAPH